MDMPALPHGWSTRATANGGYELDHEGRFVGWLSEDSGKWRISIIDANAWRSLVGDPEVELQGLPWNVVLSLALGAFTVAVVLCEPGTTREARAESAAQTSGYAFVRDANPTVRTHRAAPLLADRAGVVGKTAILVVRSTETEAHGDIPVRIDRVEERDGHLVYSGVVAAPSQELPADMQRQLRKDWYPAPGTRVEFSAQDVRDILELRVNDLPPELRPRQ